MKDYEDARVETGWERRRTREGSTSQAQKPNTHTFKICADDEHDQQ